MTRIQPTHDVGRHLLALTDVLHDTNTADT